MRPNTVFAFSGFLVESDHFQKSDCAGSRRGFRLMGPKTFYYYLEFYLSLSSQPVLQTAAIMPTTGFIEFYALWAMISWSITRHPTSPCEDTT
jgi:hypothetical protein